MNLAREREYTPTRALHNHQPPHFMMLSEVDRRRTFFRQPLISMDVTRGRGRVGVRLEDRQVESVAQNRCGCRAGDGGAGAGICNAKLFSRKKRKGWDICNGPFDSDN